MLLSANETSLVQISYKGISFKMNILPGESSGLSYANLNIRNQMKIEKYDSAANVHPRWDELATSYFQKRKFFQYCETYNYCKQRYYGLSEDDELQACACVYTLRLDLLTFLKIKSPLNFNMVGIPASVSDSGIFGKTDALKMLLQYILRSEKGFTLCLNLPPDFYLENTSSMRTLPTVRLTHDFSSWEQYMKSLRAPYRRRLKLIQHSSAGIVSRTSPCSDFDQDMYNLYLQIMQKTTTKLETLTLDFFKYLPPEFSLTTYSKNGVFINWHIVLKDGDNYVFFYGGTDYRRNRFFNGYFNNLAGIVREGIESGFKRIEFGQTAELAKSRFGGAIIEKKILLYSNNILAGGLLKLVAFIAGYRRKIPVPHVFREDSLTIQF